MEERDEIWTDDDLFKQYGIVKNVKQSLIKTSIRKFKENCTGSGMKRILKSTLPISTWLPNYKIKQSIVGDVTAGLTVGIVHIPQGMAYALLASLPPITGLYSSFFPVLTYALFATSRHLSIGTFAVVSLMISSVIEQRVPMPSCINMENTSLYSNLTVESVEEDCQLEFEKRKIQIAVALCVSVSIIHFIMFVLRFGIITVYLSSYMVSAFTCGAAVHVMTSQVAKLIGVSVQNRSGCFSIIYTYVDIVKNISSINWVTSFTSLLCLTILFIGKEVNERFKRRLPFPIPGELVVVIFATIASYYGMLNSRHDVSIVGNIPQGIQLSVPQSSDIGLTFADALPIAIVIFSVSISLSRIFADKHNYEINANQELLAYSVSNIVSSFFCCFPAAPSLSRSSIWEDTGGTTQVTGILSALVILIVLLWIGPMFECLPQACLAAVIVVNLKSLLLQFKEVKPLYKICISDAVVWIVTWLTVVFLGVDVGLICGVGVSLLVVIYRTQSANGYMLVAVGDTNVYRNSNTFEGDEMNNIKIFKFDGPLYFANVDRFKKTLFSFLDINSTENITQEKEVGDDMRMTALKENRNSLVPTDLLLVNSNSTPQIDYLVLNMEGCMFMDGDGAKMLTTLYTHLLNHQISTLFANCSGQVWNCLKAKFAANAIELPSDNYFVSVMMAVKYAKSMGNSTD